MNDLDQIQTIDDYFREFSHYHVKKATELREPLHVPGRDPLPDFSDVNRQPFEPQAHVIAAAIKMLDQGTRAEEPALPFLHARLHLLRSERHFHDLNAIVEHGLKNGMIAIQVDAA